MKSAGVTTEQTLFVAAFHFLLVSFGAKIISLTSYSSRRTSNSVEIFVWIRFHHFVWDFKLNFKFH